MRKHAASVLRQMGEPALNRLKRHLSEEKNKEKLVLLLELAGHMGKEELLKEIEVFLKHADTDVRRQAILSLGRIEKTDKVNEILSALLNLEKNKELQVLIKKILK